MQLRQLYNKVFLTTQLLLILATTIFFLCFNALGRGESYLTIQLEYESTF
jgi:hypothetical protein